MMANTKENNVLRKIGLTDTKIFFSEFLRK